MNKWVMGLIVGVLVLLGATFVLMKGQTSPETTSTTNTTSTSASPAPTPTGDTATATASVEIKNFAFNPSTIKVKKGTTVTWTNQDSTRHDVVSTSDSAKKGLSSPLLAKGQTYSFTFNEVGVYKYLCQPHASSMLANVEVVE